MNPPASTKVAICRECYDAFVRKATAPVTVEFRAVGSPRLCVTCGKPSWISVGTVEHEDAARE